MPPETWLWIVFAVLVVALLAIDIIVSRRRRDAMPFKTALAWSGLYIGVAIAFMGLVYWGKGKQPALEFLTGYLIEESLSVDNLFVFLLIFGYFAVRPQYQRDVLFWGIIGAMVFRAIFIVVGVALIHRFEWVIYVFGAILIFSGIKMALQHGQEIHPENNPLLRLFRKIMPVTTEYDGHKLFVKRDGRTYATPLFVVLLVIETTDLIFAVDSIPAVLAITTDPFIVYTSNVFAILGLRALYFALAGVMELFHLLHYGLSLILVFVGTKMLLSAWHIKIPIGVALGVVAGILVLSVVASLIWRKKEKVIPPPPPVPDEPRL